MNLFEQETNPLFDYSTTQVVQKRKYPKTRKPRPKFDRPRHDVIQPDDPSIRLIPLTKGKNAIVDAADYEWLMQRNWYARQSNNPSIFYACRADGKGWIPMHRAIMSHSPGFVIDHINGNTLDNRRSNLRTINQAQNMWNWRPRNGRRFRGVTKTESGRWRAFISLGSFDTEEEAAMMYDKISLIIRGEFATLNFPKEG